jgi:hypothetical protein
MPVKKESIMHALQWHFTGLARKTVRIGFFGSGAIALCLAQAGTAVAAPAATATLTAVGVPMTLVHSVAIRGGDVATTWKAGGVEVKTVGLPGTTVWMRRGPDSAQASAVPPSSAARITPAQYARSGRSVYWEALAAGASKAEAVRMTLALGDSLPAAAHVSAVPKFRAAGIFYSACTTAENETVLVYGTACLQQSYLETQPGAYYLDNQVTSSGSSELFNNVDLTQLQGSYCWCDNGYTYTRVGWSPSGTIYEGNPVTYTLSASGAGFTVSVQEDQYPQTLSPIFPSGVSEPAFGSAWDGSNNFIVDSANSVAVVHEGPGSPGPADVVAGISWVET